MTPNPLPIILYDLKLTSRSHVEQVLSIFEPPLQIILYMPTSHHIYKLKPMPSSNLTLNVEMVPLQVKCKTSLIHLGGTIFLF